MRLPHKQTYTSFLKYTQKNYTECDLFILISWYNIKNLSDGQRNTKWFEIEINLNI